MPDLYEVEYSIDGGISYTTLTSSHSGVVTKADLNVYALENLLPKGTLFRTYKNGYSAGDPNSNTEYRNGGGTNIQFTSYYTKTQHKYMCVVQAGEFIQSFNPTLYDDSGSLASNIIIPVTGSSAINFTIDENFRVFATSIGLYDDANNLIAFGKFANPIKIEKELDSIFVIKFDA